MYVAQLTSSMKDQAASVGPASAAMPDTVSVFSLIPPIVDAIKAVLLDTCKSGSQLRVLRQVSKGLKESLPSFQGFRIRIDGGPHPTVLPSVDMWKKTPLTRLHLTLILGKWPHPLTNPASERLSTTSVFSEIFALALHQMCMWGFTVRIIDGQVMTRLWDAA